MLTVYVVPEDLVDADWLPTVRSLALLNLAMPLVRCFTLVTHLAIKRSLKSVYCRIY